MHFRPCIDIHNGKVKQIVGGSLTDEQDYAKENFVSEQDAAWYARKYRRDGLKGGHIIQLNSVDSPYYPATKEQALSALRAYPGGLQAGGGITPEALSPTLAVSLAESVTSYPPSLAIRNMRPPLGLVDQEPPVAVLLRVATTAVWPLF